MSTDKGQKSFWDIVDLLDWKEENSGIEVVEPAVTYLAKQSDDFIFSFDEQLHQHLYDIDGIRLGEMFMNVNDGYLSPDGFLYSKCLIVAEGEEYYSAIKNGEEIPEDDTWLDGFEDLLYIAQKAWDRKHPNLRYPYILDINVNGETGSNERMW